MNDERADIGERKPAWHYATLAAALVLIGLGVYLGLWPTSPSPAPGNGYVGFFTVDPALIAYEERDGFAVGLAKPTCLAISPDGEIAVGGDKTVRFFKATGEQTDEIAVAEAPTCLAYGADSSLYIGYEHGFFIAGSDKQPKRVDCGANSIVRGIALLGGRVFVADAGGRKVAVFGSDGNRLADIARRRDNDDGLVIYQPHLAIAAGDDGLLRVADPGRHRLKIYAPDGVLLGAWPRRPSMAIDGFASCCNPVYIALLAEGRVVTSEKGIPRIKIYSPQGDFLAVVAPPTAFTGNAAQPIAVADDKVFVLDLAQRRIRIFLPCKKIP